MVATLPDLSIMVSQTYVNEIDISKIKIKQPVEIGIDAFPGKKYKGHVSSIANVGEQLPNIQSKVFEVMISIEEKDTTLRPSMTTSNIILTETLPANTIYVPLDCIQGADTFNFVYVEHHGHIVKREVIPGASNGENAEIKAGLSENEMVFLTTPADAGKIPVERLSQEQKAKFRKKTDSPKTGQSAASNAVINNKNSGNIIIVKK